MSLNWWSEVVRGRSTPKHYTSQCPTASPMNRFGSDAGTRSCLLTCHQNRREGPSRRGLSRGLYTISSLTVWLAPCLAYPNKQRAVIWWTFPQEVSRQRYCGVRYTSPPPHSLRVGSAVRGIESRPGKMCSRIASTEDRQENGLRKSVSSLSGLLAVAGKRGSERISISAPCVRETYT